jgi:hypothetical protein
MPTWAYAIVCLSVPMVWALVLVRGLAVWTRRQELAARRRAGEAGEDFRI